MWCWWLVAGGFPCFKPHIPTSLRPQYFFFSANDRSSSKFSLCREAFFSFVQEMLTWLPEKRKTARELMDYPFLKLGG
ncbi:hypothetical protein BO71DRAFT_199638 [Aspergillus ellipticus CBS 707.79]|uniref:Protein kinase domain-containing protein n=1 Tax=Aspergillus ellipticus CBS 707.79 TaxID=1448320 RepID=A0A319DNI6_9EURO|nr:hypothetical protein BO71DRAFT_199638 [Aspergillus ellipticus CBS 707.79]